MQFRLYRFVPIGSHGIAFRERDGKILQNGLAHFDELFGNDNKMN